MCAGHCLQFNSIHLSFENTKIVSLFTDKCIWTCGPGGEKTRLEEDVREADLTYNRISCL